MRNLKKPAFYFGIATHVIFFLGLGLYIQGYSSYVMYAGLVLGLVFWIWSIIEVINADDLKRYQRNFWLILVIAVPMFGGLVYYILHQRRGNIAAD
jgi:hypothetical protein